MANEEYERILASDLPQIDKLAQAFDVITSMYVDIYANQADLLRAVKDQDALVKEQIKLELMKFSRVLFADTFFRVTGRRPWHG